MAPTYKTPGVYVEEKTLFPPSVAEVETAVPAFIGYTEKATVVKTGDLLNVAREIYSLKEYEKYYGLGPPTSVNWVILNNEFEVDETVFDQKYFLYDSLKMFFANGGGKCYIISVGYYSDDVTAANIISGLGVLEKKDEPTLILFPDASKLNLGNGFYDIQTAALTQCGKLKDRFAVLDLQNKITPSDPDPKGHFKDSNDEFRENIGMENLKYGAAYTPWIMARINKDFTYADIKDKLKKGSASITILLDLVPKLKPKDVIIITAILADYNQLIDIRDDIRMLFGSPAAPPPAFTGYGSTNYNLQAQYAIKVKAFRDAMSVPNPTAAASMNVIITAYMDLNVEAFKLIEFIDGIFNTLTLVTAPIPSIKTKMEANADGAGEELTSLILLNNTISNLAPGLDFIGVTTGYNVAGGTWNHFLALVNTLLTPTAQVDDSVFVNSAAAIALAVAIPQVQNQMRIDNMRATESIVSNAFNTFYNTLNAIYNTIQSQMTDDELNLIKSYPLYKNIITAVNNTPTLIPPSGAVVGRYSFVDATRGVWKAPANVSISNVAALSYDVVDEEQNNLNVDTDSGKSINVIRNFTGKGTLIWGARTLAGNDNEWRYVPVRRFFNMVEESVKKSTAWAVFEPNDANTWVRVKGMIENFLILQWRNGALQGAKPDDAFFVKVGLGETMTSLDILEGRMIVKIGMAVVRPAEFIILEFSHKMAVS